MKPICVLHVENKGNSTGEIKFNEVTWTKTLETSEQRKACPSNSKYTSICLPESYSAEIGYHYECYRKYTKIHKTVKAENESESKRRKSDRLELI